jgi:hypothetical protein
MSRTVFAMAMTRFRSSTNRSEAGTFASYATNRGDQDDRSYWHGLCYPPRVRIAFAVLCLLATTGCDESQTGPTVALNERFTLAPGSVTAIRDEDVRVRFDEVTGDSRCPADALCIQGGDALVHIRVSDGASTNAYVLHTGDSSRASIVHGSLRVALVELQPYPFSSRTIVPGDYRATFSASRP